MNNKHIQELTFRLSHALDQNYDVVNLDAVLSVISALEGATITKEQLEATRLAKYINQLRRRTKSEQLARRAKSLLKKWREMVGIQQQTNESLSNQNILALTSTQHQQLYHRSQPTSPIVGSSVVEQVGVNNADKLSSGDFFRSTASNPALTSSVTMQSANYKRLAAVSGTNLSNVPIPTVPANGGSHSLVQLNRTDIASQKQPTSFANLLTGINSVAGGQVSGSNMADLLSSPSFRKSNKRKERNSSQTVGTVSVAAKSFGLDQTSSSNVDFSRSSALRSQLPISNMVPIVIDIQDSNSDSDVIVPTPMPTTPTTGQLTGTVSASASKFKKSKKDKKRKEREIQPQGYSLLSSSINANITNVIDESCSNQQKPSVDQEYEKFVPIVDDRSRVIYPISGISEILSLSNSSMSSMFPNSTAVAATAIDCAATSDKHKIEATAGSNSNAQTKPLSTSDLTFAGKFKQHSSAGSSELFAFNGNRTDASTTEVVVNDSSSSHIRTSTATYTFVPFSGSGCNSNDSTSNSRTSQFDIIDVVNQDNSQSKIIDELRHQHKKHNIISTQQTQSQSQLKPSMALNVGDQILMPPTSTTNLRQLINVGESNVATTDPKIPKKRGRKKGSKGVDSVIAKETSLCSQMLMTTLGCKKVKTTKELYTEMQNRKLGVSSTTSSPTMSNWLSHQQLSHISRPSSSCSEPSLHSPRTSDACSTNATVSTVATRSSPDKITCYNSVHGEIDVTDDTETNTSGPSRDSATGNSHLRRRPSTDSTSNSQLPTKMTPISSKQPTNYVSVESLKQQIKELLSQLPPVPTMEKIEWESIKDVIPCTCKVIECEPTIDANLENSETKTFDANELSVLADLNKNEVDFSKTQQLNNLKTVNTTSLQSNQKEVSEVDVKPAQLVQPAPPKPIKSIFDLDFDDDEDPLHQIRAEAAATPAMKIEIDVLEVKTENLLKQESTDLDKLDSSALPVEINREQSVVMSDQASVQLPSPIIFPTYSVEEDPKCVAKERFELQTQKITKFHITALHNCYIPNVNGNWDNAETTPTHAATITANVATIVDITVKNDTDKVKPADTSAPTIADLWNNVVPQYGSLITEYIPKDLSHVTFTPNFISKMSSRREKSHYYLPFLGVARRYLKSKELSRRLKLKRIQEHTSCDRLAHCKENAEQFSEDHVLEEISQNIKTETNNNNDHVYVKCDINSECVNISLIATPVTEGMEKESTMEQHSSKSSLNDNVIPSLTTDTSSNKMLSSDIDSRASNIVYSGITIDIAEDLSVEPTGNVQKINYDIITRNLLTIAKLPGNANTEQVPQSNLYENAANYQSYENQNDQNVNNNSAPTTSAATTTVMLTEGKSVSLLSSCSTLEKHVDSRRSSSCSNSSLKQTQNSINMKLRRRRLQQQQLEKDRKLSAPSQKPYGKRSRRIAVDTKDKKPRIVKTIKLAINGNVTSQMPIPIGSSSNSTDDDDDEYKYDYQNSAGSRSSQFDDDVMDEYNDVNKNSYTIDEYIEEDNNENEGDGDDEDEDHEDEYDDVDCDDYDDDYGYVGDYHEVVTRNISATSTGNNHIVLTIKKTPSKTNSPSDSLSAMSPVITTAQAMVAKPVETVDQFTASTDLTLIDNDDETLKLTKDAVSSCDNDIVEVVVQTEETSIETMPTADTEQEKPTVSQVLEDTNTASTHIELDASPTFLIVAKGKRKRRMKKTYKLSKCSDSSSGLNRKLHNQLFFPHELQTIAFGVTNKVLNISSCSSSCAEDSEFEYDTATDDDDIERKVQISPLSPQPLPNTIYYLKDQQNRNKTETCCTTLPTSDSETATSVSSHASEDQDFDSVVAVRKESKAGELKHSKEEVIKQSRRQKKKRHRLIKPNGDVNAFSEYDVVAKAKEEKEDNLALENNGLLHSFNNIYVTPEQVEQNQRMARRMNSDDDVEFIESVAANDIDRGGVVNIDDFEEKKQQQQQHPNENCDDYSNFYNYNNNSKLDNSYDSLNNIINSSNNSGSHNEHKNEASTAIRGLNIDHENATNNDTQTITNRVKEEEASSTQKLLIPHKEYRTGLRAVDEDVDDEDGNNCARIQQFKEWHQVLQLRSYNDELLTVMPYVVLE